MPTTRFTVHTSLSPSDVMELLTDFGPDRARRWPNIDAAHFKVHDVGPDWAEVTEGNAMGWEHERYAYISDPGVVSLPPVSSSVLRPERIWGQPP